MSIRKTVFFIPTLLAVVLMTADRGAAQFQNSLLADSASVSGSIENTGAVAGPLVVQLCDRNGGRCFAEADVRLDGTFVFANRPAGDGVYEVRVVRGGAVIDVETAWIGGRNDTLTLRLPNPKPAISTEATVSLARLRNAPPPKAQKLFAKAAEAAAKGDEKATMKWLQKAIDVHPQFIEARNNLAVRLIKAARYEEAMKQLEQVVELDPHEGQGWTNLALALGRLGDAAGSERAAKRAVEEQPQSTQAHYTLALALLAQDKDLDEAAAGFDRVSSVYPVAQVLRAQALLGTGDIGGARVALYRFLTAAKAR